MVLVLIGPNDVRTSKYRKPGEGQTLRFHFSNGIRGFGVLKLRLGRIIRFSNMRTALMTPATPLAPSRCPTFVLMEPILIGCPGSRSDPNTREIAPVSIGSPACVPVPWASTTSVSFGSRPARAYTSRMRVSCAAPLGSVIPGVRPSWFDPLPRMTARIVFWSRMASASGLSMRQPTASPRA